MIKKLMFFWGILVFILLIFASPIASSLFTDDVVAYYPYVEGSGAVADDYSGNNNDMSGLTGTFCNWTTGVLDSSMHSNGTDFVNQFCMGVSGSNTGITGSEPRGISFWANRLDTAALLNWVQIGDISDASGTDSWAITTIASGAIQIELGGSSCGEISLSLPSPTEFFHIVSNFNGTTVQWWINGLPVGNATCSPATADNPIRLFKESEGGGTAFERGIIDELGVWNRVLSNNEISQLYNSGNGFNPFATQSNVSLILPTDEEIINSFTNIVQLNATIKDVLLGALTNSTYFVWKDGILFNSSFSTRSGSEQNISLDLIVTDFGTYEWNVEACSTNSEFHDCSFAPLNFTFFVTALENNQTFNNVTFEVSSETFSINIVLNSSAYSSIIATLNYNNTEFPGSTTDTGDTRIYTASLTTPGVPSDTDIEFHWELRLINLTGDTNLFNSSFNNQTVLDINLDDCSVNTVLFMNLTVLDEDTQDFLIGGSDNVTIEVDLSLSSILSSSESITFNKTFSFTNPARICISDELLDTTIFTMDAQIKYQAFDHVSEFYYIQNATITNNSIPQIIQLFDLDIANSQEFLITFKDVSFIPVPDVLIQITRKYIGEGVFKTVEIPKTDISGQTIGHLVLSDVVYTIIVTKQGQVLATFNDVIAICNDISTGQCTINLNAFTSGTQPSDYTNLQGVSFTLTYDDSTRTFSSIFTTSDGTTSTMILNVTEISNTINAVCDNTLTTSAGTLSCVIPSSFGNTTIRGQLFKDGFFVAELFVQLVDEGTSDAFGNTGIILLLILYITLPLMFITERVGVVIFAIFGFIFAGILGIYTGGEIFGLGSVILWFIVAGGILLYKITRKRQ